MALPIDIWAKKWLDDQREAGVTGLTVEKKKDGHHYVVKATSVWDKENKKVARAHGEYLGRLQPDGTFIKRARRTKVKVRTVRCSGIPNVLYWASSNLLPALMEEFPHHYKELIALAWTRVAYTGTLKAVREEWDMMDDVMNLRPSVGPDALSDVLHEIGADLASQQRFFSRLAVPESKDFAVDLSVCFSRAKGATLIKRGFNRFRLSYTQFKLLLICNRVTGMPISMRPIPGNLREMTLKYTLKEMGLEGCILVLDRGFFSYEIMKEIKGKEADFIIAAKRNSKAYNHITLGNMSFFWNKRSIRYGFGELDGLYWYRFEDIHMKGDEQSDALTKAGTELSFEGGKQGNIMICSSLKIPPVEIYRMYKGRESIEQCFDSGKNILSMDRTCMRDDDGIRGHLFVTFLAMRIRLEIARQLNEKKLLGKITPEDVLRKYSTVYKITSSDADIEYDIGTDLKKFDLLLGLNIYQSNRS